MKYGLWVGLLAIGAIACGDDESTTSGAGGSAASGGGAAAGITDCLTLCEATKPCDPNSYSNMVGCTKYCDEIAAANEQKNCASEFSDLVSCYATQTDVCGDGCTAEATAHFSCTIAGAGGAGSGDGGSGGS